MYNNIARKIICVTVTEAFAWSKNMNYISIQASAVEVLYKITYVYKITYYDLMCHSNYDGFSGGGGGG